MYSRSIPLFLIASLASASPGLHHVAVSARRSLEILLPRQTSDQCTATCAPIQSSVSSCTTITCLCTEAVVQSLQVCVNCAVTADPTPGTVSTAQGLIQTFETTCETVTGLPVVTIPSTSTGTLPPSGTTTANSPNAASTTVSTQPGTTANANTLASAITSISSISQVVIGPNSSSTPPTTSAVTSSTPPTTSAVTSSSGLPLKSSASSKVVLRWAWGVTEPGCLALAVVFLCHFSMFI